MHFYMFQSMCGFQLEKILHKRKNLIAFLQLLRARVLRLEGKVSFRPNVFFTYGKGNSNMVNLIWKKRRTMCVLVCMVLCFIGGI